MKDKTNCERCGACCSDILPLSPDEILTLKAYAETHRIKDRQRNLAKCPFLRRHRCAVYKVRPAVCRIYDCRKPEQEIFADYHRQIGIAEPRSVRAAIYYAAIEKPL